MVERCPCCRRLMPLKKALTAEEVLRQRSRRDEATGCLIWIAGLDRDGYGRCAVRRFERSAHRLAYETWVGPVPEGLHVLHSCDTRACIEPAHLFAGTNLDNVDDRERKGRGLYGEKSPHAKLTDDQARKIILSSEPTRILAARYGVRAGTIRDIRSGRKRRRLHTSLRAS